MDNAVRLAKRLSLAFQVEGLPVGAVELWQNRFGGTTGCRRPTSKFFFLGTIFYGIRSTLYRRTLRLDT
ncbi:MAG: hypothetical protein XU15_C0013G0036 [candidate division NC10 bacterium CSP1-5]|nr:MAG: hypothetical protein XU15_C0013G0036 [candidate division NC10 bacterium CSP1-5]